MSVPKSERKQSQQEYVTILQQVEVYFLDQYAKDNLRIPYLSDKLCDLSIQAYNEATRIFEMTIGTVRGTVPDKKKYCKKAIWAIRELASQINILMIYKMREGRSTNELVGITRKLLKAMNLIQQMLNSL